MSLIKKKEMLVTFWQLCQLYTNGVVIILSYKKAIKNIILKALLFQSVLLSKTIKIDLSS